MISCQTQLFSTHLFQTPQWENGRIGVYGIHRPFLSLLLLCLWLHKIRAHKEGRRGKYINAAAYPEVLAVSLAKSALGHARNLWEGHGMFHSAISGALSDRYYVCPWALLVQGQGEFLGTALVSVLSCGEAISRPN